MHVKLLLSKINALQTRDDVLHPARARYKAEPEKKRTIRRAKYRAEPEKVQRTAKRQWHKAVLDGQELKLRLNTIKSPIGM